jgi:pantetheine-phosphate adenylyltransferase
MISKAVYPGTFDPPTLGHMDLIERGRGVFPELIIAVADHPPKETLFTTEERLAMLRQVTEGMSGIKIVQFNGLLVNFVRSLSPVVVLRGLRALSDFEYEFQMALTNRKLAPEVETLFLMPQESLSYIRSSTVKEVAALGGDVSTLVPTAIMPYLEEKFPRPPV